ncbi:hypothetical protein L484_015272 [Morus notabilis]|uniref:Uncharacterized protein n=1 Tax=Morus notabilis TaxID=981085 RepID=W9RHU6_9ROSA|nr:hypothetical protein L484_015272 [Morus notabilis]
MGKLVARLELEPQGQAELGLREDSHRNDRTHGGLRDRDVGITSLGAGPETRTDPLLRLGTELYGINNLGRTGGALAPVCSAAAPKSG